MRRLPILAGLCLVAWGCSDPQGGGGGGPGPQAGDPNDVYEAVFRYRLQKHGGDDAGAYLSIDGKDPPVELMKRLQKDWPNLKPISEEPKEKGFHIHVENLKWIAPDRAEVRAGHWFPTKFAGEGRFGDHHLIRLSGKWVVERVDNEVMS